MFVHGGGGSGLAIRLMGNGQESSRGCSMGNGQGSSRGWRMGSSDGEQVDAALRKPESGKALEVCGTAPKAVALPKRPLSPLNLPIVVSPRPPHRGEEMPG